MSNTSIEDRLRAHLDDVAAHDPLPGPSTDEAYSRTLRRLAETDGPGGRLTRRLPVRPLAIAAAIATLCAAAAVLAANLDGDSTVTTPGPDGDITVDTTVPPTTQPEAPVTTPTTASTVAPTTTSVAIVGPSGLVGWWDGAGWRPAIANGSRVPDIPVRGGEEYQVLGLDEPATTAVGGWGDGCGISEDPGTVPEVDLGRSDSDWRTPTRIAATGVSDPRPRSVRVLPGGEEYRAAAIEVLSGLGISDTDPDIAQVVASDLDGDGTDEVLVVAERTSTTPEGYLDFTGTDDYSVAFIRKVVGGSVQTTVIHQSIAEPVPNTSLIDIAVVRVAAVADLNGDGRMEVVVEHHFWEGSTIDVHELDRSGQLRAVLTGSC